jgi:hypothetical protein
MYSRARIHKCVIFIPFPRQQWFANSSHCYVIRTLSVLLSVCYDVIYTVVFLCLIHVSILLYYTVKCTNRNPALQTLLFSSFQRPKKCDVNMWLQQVLKISFTFLKKKALTLFSVFCKNMLYDNQWTNYKIYHQAKHHCFIWHRYMFRQFLPAIIGFVYMINKT